MQIFTKIYKHNMMDFINYIEAYILIIVLKNSSLILLEQIHLHF